MTAPHQHLLLQGVLREVPHRPQPHGWGVAQETGELHVVDHIVPKINPLVCGLHVPANLQVLHWRVNTQKANLWWPDMWAAMIAAVPAPPASAEGV